MCDSALPLIWRYYQSANHLDQPFRIREPAPQGHKKCQNVLPCSDFYRDQAQCRPCFHGVLQREKRNTISQKSRRELP